MVVRKINLDSLRTMSLFGSVCGSEPIDCFEVENDMIFVMPVGQTGKAIGKKGINVKKLQSALKKDVKIIESADTPENLVKNYMFPIKAKSINCKESIVEIIFGSGRERRFILDNNQKELKKLKSVVQRYFPQVNEIIIPHTQDKVYKD